MAVNSPPSCFSIKSSSRSIDASTLSSMVSNPLYLSFLDTYSQSMSFLRCNGHQFSCSLVHLLKFFSGPFEKESEYLTRCTAQVFIPLIRFLLDSFVSSSFLVLPIYSLLIILSSPFVWWCHPPRCLSICRFPSLRAF